MGETHTRTCAEQGESSSNGERTPSTMAVSPRESAEFPTSVKEVLTLLGNPVGYSPWPSGISNDGLSWRSARSGASSPPFLLLGLPLVP
jgi:hypothetical protein